MPRHVFVINANRLQTWCITLLSFNLAKLIGFLVFSCIEVAYINPSGFVTLSNNLGENNFCKFSVFVNKVLYF